MTEHTFSIAFSADENFSVPLGVAVYSLLLHAEEGRHFDIHVLDGGVTAKVKRMIEDLKEQYPSFSISYWDLKNQFKDLPSDYRFTTATYYRLKLASLLPHVKTIFYIDADILVCKDLGDLYSIDLENYYAAATQDFSSAQLEHEGLRAYRKAFGIPDDGRPYFCAGQMLLNLELMRRDKIEEKMMQTLYSVPPEALGAPDQDVINCVMGEKIRPMSYRFGSIAIFEDRILHGEYLHEIGPRCIYTEEELKEATLDPSIIHYATAKPNILIGPRNMQEAKFFDIWQQSPWYWLVPFAPFKIKELATRTNPFVGKMLMFFPRLAIRCPRLLKAYGKLLSAGTRFVRPKP